MVGVPIEILGNRAILNANPEAKLVTFLDRWKTSGYMASLGESGDMYVIGRVIYDLTKVPIEKVREVAQKVGEGLFECPVCMKLATGNEKEKEDVEKASEEKKAGEEVREPEECELDEVEVKELERERAIQRIVNAMDEVLLYKVLL